MYRRSALSFWLVDFLFEIVAGGNSFSYRLQTQLPVSKLRSANKNLDWTVTWWIFLHHLGKKDVFLDIFQLRKTIYSLWWNWSQNTSFPWTTHSMLGRTLEGIYVQMVDSLRMKKIIHISTITSKKKTRSTGNDEIRENNFETKWAMWGHFYGVTDNCCLDKDFYPFFDIRNCKDGKIKTLIVVEECHCLSNIIEDTIVRTSLISPFRATLVIVRNGWYLEENI